MNTLSTIKNLRNQEEDFEWYPTTNEILESFEKDLETFMEDSRKRTYNCSFLDIGAGDGKVLKRVKEKFKTNLFVEKSQFHNSNMDKDFCLMGTDFHKTTFIDKEVDIVFSNPPYSEFKEWAKKILKEFCQGTLIYLGYSRKMGKRY
jgi:16S rRNA A1518/A1519 N6-dimethyltransferase RsmA/KsgA/DIM1 with predicted DNA glycosylase/AP lyase activity